MVNSQKTIQLTLRHVLIACGPLKHWKLLLLCCIWFLVAGNVSGQMTNQPTERYKALLQETGVGAVTFALVEGKEIVSLGGYGMKSLKDSTRVNAQAKIRIGSITKTLTALALLRLVETKNISLNTAIRPFTKRLPLSNPFTENPITVEMLLEHTAGLMDLSRKEFDYPRPLSLPEAFLVDPNHHKVQWPAGRHPSYTNLGSGYLSAVVQSAVKEDYDQWFNREVLHRIGMKSSQLHWDETLQKELVQGYDQDLRTPIPFWHTLYRAFGNVSSTAEDMANLLILLINQGRLKGQQLYLSSSIERMQTPTTSLGARAGITFGYGLGLRSELYQGVRIFEHGGDADGYLAHLAYSPESKRGFFVVVNAFRGDLFRQFKQPLYDWMIADIQPQDPPSRFPLREEILASYTGDYKQVTQRFSFQQASAEILKIRMRQGKLHRFDLHYQRWIEMIPVARNLFRDRDENAATHAFIPLAGKLVLQGALGNWQRIETVSD